MTSPLAQLMQPAHPGWLAGLDRTTAPDNSPLLTTVKAHLRVTTSAEDALLQGYIDAAVEYVELAARRSLFDQAWTLTLDSFPTDNFIQLYMGPVKSITTFTTYDDNNDPTTTFSDYVADTAGDRLLLNDGATWPTDLRAHAAVTILYATGHGTAEANLPWNLKQAVLLLVGHWFTNREAVGCAVTPELTLGVSALIAQSRNLRL